MDDKPSRRTPTFQSRGPLISGPQVRQPPRPLNPASFDRWVKHDLWQAGAFMFLLQGKHPPPERWEWIRAWENLMIEPEKRMEGLRFNMELLEVFSLVRGAAKIGALIPVDAEEWARDPDKGEFLAVDLVRWAVGKGFDVPAPLLVLLEDEPKTEAPPGIDTTGFSDELKIAIEAGQYLAGLDRVRGTPRQALLDWLKEQHPELGAKAHNRIATMANTKKKGGPPGYRQ